jgi:hypothetical protein
MLKRKKKKKEFKKDFFGRDVEEINEEKPNRYFFDHSDEVAKKYLYKYQGYFIADSFINGGQIYDTILETPFCLAKRDHTRNGPLISYKQMTDGTFARIRRLTEKLNDMESYIRGEMIQKKRRAFKQQKHYFKKTMLFDDQYGIGMPIVKARYLVREHRLKQIDELSLKSERARIPRLQLKDENKIHATHLKKAFDRIIPSHADDDKASGYSEKYPYVAGEVDKTLALVAISDFEEARERQALTKYDKIWARAEAAYIKKKKKQNQTLNESLSK